MSSTTTSWKLLAALGLLSAAGTAAAVDTSQWKCEACPYPKAATSGEIEAGAGAVSGDRQGFGDYSGLNGKKRFAVLGGTLKHRGAEGYEANLAADNLGLDSRSLAMDAGLQGSWRVGLAYAEIPHRIADAGTTPFAGVGSGALTLPAGFPAASTQAMPLGNALHTVDLGAQRKNLALTAQLDTGSRWSHSVTVRHDVRDGTQRLGASFFNTSSLIVAPVDQTTDTVEVATRYASPGLSLSLAYQASQFKNAQEAVSWANPFNPVVAGTTRAQMALAPDNQFHQVVATGGYALTPMLRISGDLAVGRMTQDSAFLPPSLNTNLAAALAAPSLGGKVDTFSGRVNATLTPASNLRITATAERNQRDNRTTSRTWPAVATDLFVDGTERNPTFSIKQTRLKLAADHRVSAIFRASAGAEWDERTRSYQAAVRTTESTVWARGVLQAMENVSLTLKLARADRSHSPYGSVTYGIEPQNPRLRLPYLAERRRNQVGVRADITVGESVSVGVFFDGSDDRYPDAAIGLQSARSATGGADVSWALSETTSLFVYAQDEQLRSRQAGSAAFAAPDWTGRIIDSAQVAGGGVKHSMLKGALDLTADVSWARSRSQVSTLTLVDTGSFPMASNARDSLNLRAVYKLQDKLSLVGRLWYEHQQVADWQLDGINPSTVGNLLALGVAPPKTQVNAISLALRWQY